MIQSRRLIATLISFLFISAVLDARLGDSRGDLENRLKQSKRGLKITDGDLLEFHLRRSPLGQFQGLVPEVEYALYYKVNTTYAPTSKALWESDAKGKRSSRPIQKPDGWLLHVVFFNGVSVLELYQRSESLTDVEKNGILSLHRGDSEWKSGRVPSEDPDIIQPQVLSHNHHRVDYQFYANVGGDSVLLYNPKLDLMIFDRKTNREMELAPASLDGF